jgi:hypothetical protein
MKIRPEKAELINTNELASGRAGKQMNKRIWRS